MFYTNGLNFRLTSILVQILSCYAHLKFSPPVLKAVLYALMPSAVSLERTTLQAQRLKCGPI